MSYLKQALLNPDVRRRARLRSSILVAAASVLAGAALPSSAQAALISTGACNGAQLSQPFAPWGDSSSYELLSGGNFEGSLAGWTLSGGARTVAGGEPARVPGSNGARSLLLPAGASAQSPATCVNASYPTFRFFARDSGLTSSVLVQVVFTTLHVTLTESLGVVTLAGSWQPTPVMLTNALVSGALSGGTGEVAIRFTAVGGSSQVDDVFIDPRMTR